MATLVNLTGFYYTGASAVMDFLVDAYDVECLKEFRLLDSGYLMGALSGDLLYESIDEDRLDDILASARKDIGRQFDRQLIPIVGSKSDRLESRIGRLQDKVGQIAEGSRASFLRGVRGRYQVKAFYKGVKELLSDATSKQGVVAEHLIKPEVIPVFTERLRGLQHIVVTRTPGGQFAEVSGRFKRKLAVWAKRGWPMALNIYREELSEWELFIRYREHVASVEERLRRLPSVTLINYEEFVLGGDAQRKALLTQVSGLQKHERKPSPPRRFHQEKSSRRAKRVDVKESLVKSPEWRAQLDGLTAQAEKQAQGKVFDELLEQVASRAVAAGAGFFQVGAYDGVSNDPIGSTVRKWGLAGVAVEPLPPAFERLKEVYKTCPEVRLIQGAISKTPGEAVLYTPYPKDDNDLKEVKKAERKTTLFRDKAVKKARKYHRVGTAAAEALVAKHVTRAYTVEQLQESNADIPVAILQIDAEGYDVEILKAWSFDRCKPALINFEVAGMDEKEVVGVREWLTEKGYASFKHGRDVCAIYVEVGGS